MKVVENGISLDELLAMANRLDGDLVQADVDIVRNVMIVDMARHSDGVDELIRRGARHEDIWGINLYPAKFGTEEFIEFDAPINVRTRENKRTINIEDHSVKERIREVVSETVHE